MRAKMPAALRRLLYALHRRGGIFRLIAPVRTRLRRNRPSIVRADGKVRSVFGEERRHFLLAESRRPALPIVLRNSLSRLLRGGRAKIVRRNRTRRARPYRNAGQIRLPVPVRRRHAAARKIRAAPKRAVLSLLLRQHAPSAARAFRLFFRRRKHGLSLPASGCPAGKGRRHLT